MKRREFITLLGSAAAPGRSLPASGRSRFSKIVAVSLQARTRLDAMMMIVVTTRTMPWLILPGMIARTSLSRRAGWIGVSRQVSHEFQLSWKVQACRHGRSISC